ncbi:MAG: serine hydrolase [Candidatus Paceibacterota bacterium]|jgi:CubicO group peptidase (beta-lactamase class C family)
MKSEKIEKIVEVVKNAVEKDGISGAVIKVGRGDQILLHRAFGYKKQFPKENGKEVMELDTIFDIASMTKIIATWPSVIKLIDLGLLSFDDKLEKFFPGVVNSTVGQITIKHLLTHTSGLQAKTYLKQYGSKKEDILSGILNADTDYITGEKVVYSNRPFILLGFIIEQITSMTLSQYVTKNIWQPLGMNNTMFIPPDYITTKIASTECNNDLTFCKRGVVHDENADWLGGIAGHAGVFSNSEDLSNFCQMILSCGNFKNQKILECKSIKASLVNSTEGLNESRGIAWNIFTEDSKTIYGHYGFTGTSMWIYPDDNTYFILLTNRVHPSRESPQLIDKLRKEILEIIWGK